MKGFYQPAQKHGLLGSGSLQGHVVNLYLLSSGTSCSISRSADYLD